MSEVPEVNAYEEERRLRIARNQQALKDLGLLENPISGVAEAQRRSQAAAERRRRRQEETPAGSEQQPAEPQRRSRRLQREEAENLGMELCNGPIDRCDALVT